MTDTIAHICDYCLFHPVVCAGNGIKIQERQIPQPDGRIKVIVEDCPIFVEKIEPEE